ncbi:hypothetical protein GGR21_003547 [Dysgonomonas hofstadii]|uniref:DUF4998 domain-containing protein n=1 Tax=Dysgonomonas hofstadii TaxID=637886 RepID=A0A840CNG0_9BACT|nr:DUF4998 domain-containing protein [Dysgonomonas hofstadii]MBB4037627.1 hypothetical protein [Dysgonomonas hofstadii]
MKKSKLLTIVISFVCFVFSLYSCGGMDETYKEFISDGEIHYPGKADSAQVHPGYLRAQLQWLIISDPNIIKCKIVIDGKKELDISVSRSENVDTIRTIVDNLDEGIHVFNIYTIDNNGNYSVKEEVIGQVFGANYIETLYNRRISKVEYDKNNDEVKLTWAMNPEGAIGVEMAYTDSDGVPQTILVKPEENTTLLEECPEGTVLTYKTLFVPDLLSIDIFEAPAINISIPQ